MKYGERVVSAMQDLKTLSTVVAAATGSGSGSGSGSPVGANIARPQTADELDAALSRMLG